MDKFLKRLQPSMLKFMRKNYDEIEVMERWKKTERLYEKWLLEEGDLGGSRNMMSSSMNLCYAICAFYESVDQNFTKDDFYVLLNDVMAKRFAMMNRIDMNKLEKKKRLIKLAYLFGEKYRRKSDRKRGNGWGNTWKVRINPDKREKGLAFALDTCPLYEFAQKHGYMEVLSFMCESDQFVAKQFHAHLIRHNILSDGDGKCEYWYVGDKSTEAMNDKNSK